MEPIAIVMRRRRFEWFGHVTRRDETENIRAIVETKMEGCALYRKTEVAMDRHCQEGTESLEHEGGMCH